MASEKRYMVIKHPNQPILKTLNIYSIEYADHMAAGWTDAYSGNKRDCLDYIQNSEND